MSDTPRPSRGTNGPATNVAQTIAAGPDQSPMNLPSVNPGGVPLPANSLAATAQIVSDFEDLEGDDPDTSGFLYNDQNIFESGGLSKSDPNLFKRKKSGTIKPHRVQPIAYIPRYGDVVFHNGEQYEFLGYLGDDIELSDEELASFQGDNDEYSEFGKKFFKKLGKGLKKAVKLGTKVLSVTNPGVGLGLKGAKMFKGIFRKKKGGVGFDGSQEYEYYLGPDPAEAEFLGKAFKKIGKAVGKAAKAVGKGVKTAVKATGKGIKNAAKATGKGLKNATKWVGNTIKEMSQAEEEPLPLGAAANPLQWSQQQAALESMNTGNYAPGFMPYNENEEEVSYDENGEIISRSGSQSTVQPKSNTNLIIAIAVAVLIIGGLFIYKSKK